MKLRFKRVHSDAKTPQYSSERAAALDFFAVDMKYVPEKNYYEYDTGIAIEIPEGFVGLCFSRSSVSETGTILTNGVGVIDPDYRGTVKARFAPRANTSAARAYAKGDKVFQMLIIKNNIVELEEADELTTTVRGDGGFGSTGR